MKETMEERVIRFMEAQKMRPSAFSMRIRVANTTLSQQLYGRTDGSCKGIQMNVAKAILDAFPDLSAEWLMRGEGGMMRSTASRSDLEALRDEVDELRTEVEYLKIRIGEE